MSVSELPEPGTHTNGTDVYEIRISKRGQWYGLRQEPDGSHTYIAQNVDLASLTAGERQPSGCTHTECSMPQWHRGLCGVHLAADAVRYARSIKAVAA